MSFMTSHLFLEASAYTASNEFFPLLPLLETEGDDTTTLEEVTADTKAAFCATTTAVALTASPKGPLPLPLPLPLPTTRGDRGLVGAGATFPFGDRGLVRAGATFPFGDERAELSV
jgi:hypothetical protein